MSIGILRYLDHLLTQINPDTQLSKTTIMSLRTTVNTFLYHSEKGIFNNSINELPYNLTVGELKSALNKTIVAININITPPGFTFLTAHAQNPSIPKNVKSALDQDVMHLTEPKANTLSSSL